MVIVFVCAFASFFILLGLPVYAVIDFLRADGIGATRTEIVLVAALNATAMTLVLAGRHFARAISYASGEPRALPPFRLTGLARENLFLVPLVILT